MSVSIVKADALDFLNSQEQGSIDLIIGSPPYELARLYLENGENLGIARNTEQWVAWMVDIFKASLRACKGLVAYVVEGQTRDYKYSCGPILLMAELHKQGICLRKPPLFVRDGVPGSGGPDWLRNRYEWIICATNGGNLPWSDNTAMGVPPKYGPGGVMSNRLTSGERANVAKMKKLKGDGLSQREAARQAGVKFKEAVSGCDDSGMVTQSSYIPPDIANPGNIIYDASEVIECVVGGGKMGEGSCFAEENEAPFPEKIPEFFIKSFCPPGGTVADPFSGSGTTAAVAFRHGRNFTGCDLRQSQVDLSLRRVEEETPLTLFAD
jgi:hypothetical protein